MENEIRVGRTPARRESVGEPLLVVDDLRTQFAVAKPEHSLQGAHREAQAGALSYKRTARGGVRMAGAQEAIILKSAVDRLFWHGKQWKTQHLWPPTSITFRVSTLRARLHAWRAAWPRCSS